MEIQYARSIVGFVFLGDNYYICRIKKKEEKYFSYKLYVKLEDLKNC